MTDREILDDLLDRYEDLPPGERPSSVDLLCGPFPHLRDVFRREIGLLAKIDGRMIEEAAVKPDAGTVEIPTEQVAGRYRATALLGQGGLGQVFVAEDLELGREVALKRIMPGRSALTDNQARFRREAKITGRLEHPGVVPIFGLGADSAGRPYYAMRLIRGGTLDDAIEAFHREHPDGSDPGATHAARQSLVRRFQAMCLTIAYAHAKGILHRDLKPQNVIVGDYGETIVIDWGLAKPIGETDRGEVGTTETSDTRVAPTMAGQRKGSPAYMSPEAAAGENGQVTAAADIYSLGATLYKLLTGRPPFEGGPELFDRIAEGRFARPRRIRRDVPGALQAICLKAMSLRPADRYGSAKELADDVERWLVDEPAHAWREPLAMRARRWIKRNRTIVVASIAMLFGVFVVAVAAGFILHGKNRELQTANDQLKTANESTRREFDESNHALRGVVENVIAGARLGEAAAPMLRTESLRVYQTHLSGFISRNEADANIALEVGAACLHRGEVAMLLGELELAIQSLQKAQGIFERMLEQEPSNREARYGRACAMGEHAKVLSMLGKFALAKPMLETAREAFETVAKDPTPLQLARMSSSYVVSDYPDSPAMRLAQITLILVVEYPAIETFDKANLLRPSTSTKRSPAHVKWIQTALDALGASRPMEPNSPVFVQFLAISLELLIVSEQENKDAARKRLLEIAERIEHLKKTHPVFHELNVASIQVEIKLSEVDERERKAPEARRHLFKARDAAIQLERGLSKHDPYRMTMDALIAQMEVYEKLVVLVPLPGADEQRQLFVSWDAFKACMQAVDRYAALTRHSPATTASALVSCYRISLWAIHQGGRKFWAEEAYEKTILLCETQLRETPEEEAFEIMLLTSKVGCAAMKSSQRKPVGALLDQADALLTKLDVPSNADPFLTYQRAMILATRSTETTLIKNQPAEGIRLLEKAIEVLGTANASADGGDVIRIMHLGYEIQLASTLAGWADDLLDEKPPKVDQARPLVARSRAIINQQLKRPPLSTTTPEYQIMLDHMLGIRKRILPELEKLERKLAAAK